MSWQRLEGSSIGADLSEGLEARIADPLWLLGKQWQTGELTGEDAASPILVEARFGHSPVTRIRLGPPDAGGPALDRRHLGLPLETAVEREPVRTGPAATRLAAEAGLQLWRHLDAAGAPPELGAGIRERYPLALSEDDGLDPVGRAQLALLARRACDARALHEELALRGGAALSGLPGIGRPAVRAALDAWAAWYGGLFSEPESAAAGPAWNPQRMEYRFQVAAGVGGETEVQLDAAEYTGGHLDWYSFDLANGLPELGARGQPDLHRLQVLPTPARFAGQAASRFWQVENADVWFGDINAAPEDLARVAVASFATVFGDDWYLVPCRLPAGVVARAQAVTVHDTFGERHRVRSCAELDGPERAWRFFELTGDGSADAAALDDRVCPWVFLPPALPGVVESPPLEDVVLRRDEVANLAWAAERRIESAAGRIVDRAARARAALPSPPAVPDDAWLYRLSTGVSEHQVPLVPVRSTVDGGLYLQRGRLAVAAGKEVATRGALGRILEPKSALLVHDDEVPATGVRITRSWQLARRADGGLVLWVGRRKRPAGPARSPALVFDDVLQGG